MRRFWHAVLKGKLYGVGGFNDMHTRFSVNGWLVQIVP